MLKKRQEVERLAAAGKHKYEYDSDEDTAEGTWEHKYVSFWFLLAYRCLERLQNLTNGINNVTSVLTPVNLTTERYKRLCNENVQNEVTFTLPDTPTTFMKVLQWQEM